MQRVITFNQEAWLLPYIDMNTELRKKWFFTKNDFVKDFFKWMNNVAFEKLWKTWEKNKDIKLVTTKAERNYLVSESNDQIKIFSDNLLAIETKGMQTIMNKIVYLGPSILEISERVMY